MEERFDDVITKELTPGGPGVAVAMLRDGEFIHRKAYGLANLEWNIPLVPDAVFRIASLTKQFTAVAIMRLAERGALSIDDPIEQHLPDWPPRGRTVTVRHLLNHTSGIQSYSSHPDFQELRRLHWRLERLVAYIRDLPFEFEAGAEYRYNNSGYVLLGAIIEAVSGLKYRDFLHREIFEPLAMSRTRFLFHEQVTPGRTAGYERARDGFRNAHVFDMTWSHAAGALGSTLDDLALWDRAMRENRLVSRQTLDLMLRPTPLGDGTTFPYGFGWGTGAYEGRRFFHHTGGISGFASQMLHLRDENLTAIVLSNLYLFPYDRVTRGLLRVALDLPPVPHPVASVARAELGRYAGDFDAPGGRWVITEVNGGLRAGGDLGSPLVILDDGLLCDAADPEVEYRFSDLADGRYQRLDYVSPLWPTSTYARSG